ncbi:MAG: hypothetical protein Hens3KO_08550 [Henriciella sp.]
MTKKTSDFPKDLGIEIGGPGRAYFDDIVVDNMFDAVLELSAALWTVRDRQIILERVLAQQGISVTEAIEAYLPTEEDLAVRKAERDEMAERIFKSFLRRPNADAAKSPDEPSLREITD